MWIDCIYAIVDIEESDKHPGLAENCVTGYTGRPWDSFHSMEGWYFVKNFLECYFLSFYFIFFSGAKKA